MGMSSYVSGWCAPTDEYIKKLRAYKACIEAGIKPPSELEMFADDHGLGATEEGMKTSISQAVTNDSYSSTERIIVKLSDLPNGVTHIIFENSW